MQSVANRCAGESRLALACREKVKDPILSSQAVDTEQQKATNSMISILKMPTVPEGESAVRALLQMPVIIKMGSLPVAGPPPSASQKVKEEPERARKEPEGAPPLPKEDSLNQLTQRVLPPFQELTPLSPCLKTASPPGGFKCGECGDRFSLESSLRHHMERRSVHIRLRCSGCSDATITFFNRCSYLKHVRTHRDNKDHVYINRIQVSPLSREELVSSKSPVVNSQPPESKALPPKQFKPPNGSHSLVSLAKELLESQTNGKRIVTSQGGKYRCPECFQGFDSVASREHHFGLNLTAPVSVSRCNKCNVVCASKCSLQSHQRIHLRIYPYICPECGQRCLDCWEDFMSHVHHQCMHFSRRVSYKCSMCGNYFSSKQALKGHFFTAHTEPYFKCASCAMAFKTRKGFEAHKRSSHEKVEAQFVRINKCAICEKVFLDHQPLIQHLANHFQEQNNNARFVYECPACETETKSKEQLLAHLTTHEAEGTPCMMKAKEPSAPGCVICSRVFQLKTNQTKRRHYISLSCVVCGSELGTRKKLFAHEQDHLRGGTHICLLCHKSLFRNEKEFCEHLEQHVSDIKGFPSMCSQCLVSLSNREQAIEHFRLKHFLTPTLLVTGQEEQTKRSVGRRRRHRSNNAQAPAEDPLPPIKIRIPLTLVRADSKTEQQKMDSPIKKRLRVHSEGETEDFVCAKCDFVSKGRTDFHQHIQVHRKDSSATQCLECGTCFVVETSLRKHLVVVHQVSDVETYLRRWPACLLQTPSTAPNESLQCRVCLAQFQDNSKLKSHMRSHGMAFIRSKLAASSASPV